MLSQEKLLGLYEELKGSPTHYDLHACPLPSAAPMVDAFYGLPTSQFKHI